jgi:hypothetical protein
MGIDEIRWRLVAAHAQIGFTGRFALTIDQSGAPRDGRGAGGVYITHWFRPTPYAFEDCKSVGHGTIQECLDALDLYVADFNAQRVPTELELAATLGIAPPPSNDPICFMAAE